MSAIVSLKEIASEMDMMSDEMHAYLNKETGKVVTVSDEEFRAVENGDDWSTFPDWQQEALAIAEKVLYSGAFIALPSRFDIHEYAIMQKFCYSIEDPETSEDLVYQIHGSGAFRRFKDAIYRHGIQDEWDQYRQDALEKIARDWLESEGIAYNE